MAVVDYFLKIDGIEGESTDSKHKNEIDIIEFGWAEEQTHSETVGASHGAGKIKMRDFQFTSRTNKSSPKLMLASASGEHIKSAIFIARKAGKDQQEYLKITLTNVLVSHYSITGSQAGEFLPNDDVQLRFQKIQIDYKPQKVDGTLDGAISAGWDVQANVKV